jgi:acetyl-CoA carboxylase biotin carboxyl carrier protein
MKKADLTEFEIEEENFRLRLVRGCAASAPTPAPATAQMSAPALAPAQMTPKALEGNFIKSPMVGTFYSASAPESPRFVEPDTRVSPNSVVCIIEAMKVMNEIQAEMSGTITEVLVENGQSVEYGQPLFRINPA